MASHLKTYVRIRGHARCGCPFCWCFCWYRGANVHGEFRYSRARELSRWPARTMARALIPSRSGPMSTVARLIGICRPKGSVEGGNPYGASRATGDSAFLERTYSDILLEGMRLSRQCFEAGDNSIDQLEAHIARIVADHRDLFAAIEQRKPDVADNAASRHSDLFRDRVARQLPGSPNELRRSCRSLKAGPAIRTICLNRSASVSR